MIKLSDKAKKLADVLIIDNCVYGCGGMLYSRKDRNFMMATVDLPAIIKEFEKYDILIRRIDSGGTPTWAVIES